VPSAPVLARVLHDALDAAGVAPVLPGVGDLPGVEAVRRGDALFLLNHSDVDTRVPVSAQATDLLTGAPVDHVAHVPATGAVVLVERQT
jgi:beta-galactosidase